MIFFTNPTWSTWATILQRRLFPFVDIDSGGSVQGMIAGDEKVAGRSPSRREDHPGPRRRFATKDDLRRFIIALKETSAAVEAGIKKGKTLDQLKQEKVLAKWDSWGQGFIKTDMFTEILYDSLKNKPSGPKNAHGHISK